ncbi:D-alanine--D-alanine ligase [Desulfovibrio subterraneus]|uniref:D-alanine--D-alanine ligase family protein n=1 Tax=Desulfovibrio subterraneus TaxID=2718620 RepID=UPI0022B865D8|nr:D-alanine--D-alanine ligase [Desulfovibrio subterraneus]WBF66716.1 D-alanine--D-alanine ligase [Desulfovibrio subterraneus]
MRILLIAGGWSSEREVSLSGARGIEKALIALGHNVTRFDPATSMDGLLEAASAHDFAFINLHGSPGEDGLVQAMLDAAGCPYQGSGPAGSFLALNKAVAKQIFVRHGLPTPEWVFLPVLPAEAWQPALAYPLFVKSNTGGSSLGLSRVDSQADLHAALKAIFETGDEVIIEPSVPGMEVTCGVLGDRALPPVLILPESGAGFFDYKAKYTPGAAREVCPAPIPEEVTAEAQRMALTAHRALGLSGYSRADFILDPEGNLHLLEVNTLPGMTPTSLLPQEAAAVGYSFEDLIAELIKLGLASAQRPS